MFKSIKMKRYIINKYYNFLICLEDIFGNIATTINNHRNTIDNKYWDDYLQKETKENKI